MFPWPVASGSTADVRHSTPPAGKNMAGTRLKSDRLPDANSVR